jgi:hypothetical protein
MNYGTSYGDTRASINQRLRPSLGFTFNWYALPDTNITKISGNGCLLIGSGSFCPYQSTYTSGLIYYRGTTSSNDLTPINSYISQTFSSSFSATNAFIVTFYSVIDVYGRSNTFQAVLTTDGSRYYVIYNFGECHTRNARSFVQSGKNTFILWDNTAAYYTIYSSYMYDYFNYDQSTPAQQTNACYNGQFVYSYPKQTVSCAPGRMAWYIIFIIVVVVLLGVAGIVVVFVLAVYFLKIKKKREIVRPKSTVTSSQQKRQYQQNEEEPRFSGHEQLQSRENQPNLTKIVTT